MGWSEFKAIPNEYNDEIRAIDESILKLIMARAKVAKGRKFFPPTQIVKQWAAEFDLEIAHINGMFHSLTEGEEPRLADGPGKLLNVLPIMKRQVLDGFEYSLTHAMQHEQGSIVFLEIKQYQTEASVGYIRPKLHLAVDGETEYRVRRNGAHGGGGHSELSFWVTPQLPDTIENVQFTLIPFAHPLESRPKEVVLDREIAFE